MKAKSIKGNSPEEISNILRISITDSFKPTLAIVFLSITQDSNAVCSLLDKKGISIFGATTSGEFINKEIEQGSIVIMLLDMNPAHFNILFRETEDSTMFEIAKQIGAEGKNIFSNPAFIIASGWLFNTDGEQIMAGIEEGFGAEAMVFGGIAGDDLSFAAPLVFTSGKNSRKGIVAIIIDQDKINITGLATCGWKAIGTTRTITKSSGNIVYTIDDSPALDMVIKYLGADIDLNSGKDVVLIGAYYPLQLERENVPSVMRSAIVGNKQERSLICSGNVPQGSKIRFSLPPDFEVIDKVVAECTALKNEKHPEADALIMFSCLVRHLSLGVLISEEIEQVQNVWGAPMVGFFCYGEFGKTRNGKNEFHNNTCCIVALKEK